jgi:hypothetical protein
MGSEAAIVSEHYLDITTGDFASSLSETRLGTVAHVYAKRSQSGPNLTEEG